MLYFSVNPNYLKLLVRKELSVTCVSVDSYSTWEYVLLYLVISKGGHVDSREDGIEE